MAYRVLIPPHVEARIAKLPPFLKSKVRTALDHLSQYPFEGKALKEDLAGLYSYRVARHRIVYSIHHSLLEVHVVALGHRGVIYKI